MADVKVPAKLHLMSKTYQKAWYSKHGMRMPDDLEGKSAAAAKKVKAAPRKMIDIDPGSVRALNAARQQAYMAKGGRQPIGAMGSGGSNVMAGGGQSTIKDLKASIKAGFNPKVSLDPYESERAKKVGPRSLKMKNEEVQVDEAMSPEAAKKRRIFDLKLKMIKKVANYKAYTKPSKVDAPRNALDPAKDMKLQPKPPSGSGKDVYREEVQVDEANMRFDYEAAARPKSSDVKNFLNRNKNARAAAASNKYIRRMTKLGGLGPNQTKKETEAHMKAQFEEVEQVDEGSKRMSAAVKLQRAFDREKAASDASRKRGEEVLAQARAEYAKKQAAKTNEEAEQVDEGSKAETEKVQVSKTEAEKVLGGPVSKRPKMPPGKQPAGYRYVRSLARKAMNKGLVKEEIKDQADAGEYDYEGDMAKSQLRSIMANSKRMHDMLEENTNLPEWVQSKITLAEDYISTAANYMEGEMNEELIRQEEAIFEAMKKMEIEDDEEEMDDENEMEDDETEMSGKKKKMSEEVEQIDEFVDRETRLAARKAETGSSTRVSSGDVLGRRGGHETSKQAIARRVGKDSYGIKSGGKTSIYNRSPKPNLPEEAEQVDEKAPPGAKSERMVKHIKAGYAKDGLTKQEKGIAYATAWKAYGKKEEVEVVAEAEGTVAVTPKEKELAAHHGDKTKITYGDVIKARIKSSKEKLMKGKE